jgi:hypothetical protein
MYKETPHKQNSSAADSPTARPAVSLEKKELKRRTQPGCLRRSADDIQF